MIGKTTTVLVFAAIALAGCNRVTESKADTAAIERHIRDKEAKWMAAYNSHDAGALASNYAEDAVLANPDTPLVTGLDAIRKETAGFAADPNLKIDFSSDRVGVAASGDFAYSRGHYSMTYTDPDTNKAAESTGHYLTVYRKQADGSWKAVEDFVTQGPQAEAN
jgi:uncharacterized protein (TIGR02246 family)